MNNHEKKSIKISKGLIAVIIFLLCAAIGLSMSGSANDLVEEFYSEDISNQISLELKKNQPEISHTYELEGLAEDQELEQLYAVRLNHEEDMPIFFRTDIVSSEDSIEEALKLKIYDKTNDQVIYDDSFKLIDGKEFETMLTANASKKNDIRYTFTMYFDAPVGDRYEESSMDVNFTWYVAEENADMLEASKTGDVKVIMYSFIACLVVIVVLVFVFRKNMNEKVFENVSTKEAREEEEAEAGGKELKEPEDK